MTWHRAWVLVLAVGGALAIGLAVHEVTAPDSPDAPVEWGAP